MAKASRLHVDFSFGKMVAVNHLLSIANLSDSLFYSFADNSLSCTVLNYFQF